MTSHHHRSNLDDEQPMKFIMDGFMDDNSFLGCKLLSHKLTGL